VGKKKGMVFGKRSGEVGVLGPLGGDVRLWKKVSGVGLALCPSKGANDLNILVERTERHFAWTIICAFTNLR